MLITINGPYMKYNQSLGTRVTKEVQKLYPDMKVFLYDNPPTSVLDKPINIYYNYNPFLHISSILTQMAKDIQKENEQLGSCIRDYVDRSDTLVIATEWYSSAIIRILRYMTPYESLTNLAEVLSDKDRLVDFAFNLVKEFHFTAPDLNIVFIPNETEMEDDMTNQVEYAKTLSKERAKQTKDIYTSYMNLTTNDSYNIFTRNGEPYGPIYALNSSNFLIPDTNKTLTTTTPNFLKERYRNFHKKMLELEYAYKTQTEVVEDITNIIKTYIDIVNKSIEVAASSALTPIRS